MQDYQIETKKICEIVDDDTHTILPAIQRKFVWKEEQICDLFESIMEGFPIGTFLTWKVIGKKINEDGVIGFYNFIKNYSDYDNKYNELIKNPSNDREYLAILDGQQRIQSLIIGLRGSYANHLPNKKYDKIESYPKKFLYLKLRKEFITEEEKYNYIFKFMEKQDVENDKANNWFEVGLIIGLNDEKARREYVDIHYDFNGDFAKKDEALEILSNLNTCINDRALLGCYAIDKNRELDDILDIFVRINSGGTKLSKPDLLFSTIISKWNDAREEFDSFLKNINLGEDESRIFKFDIDFLIRTILYVFDISVTLNIKNFKKLDIILLKEKWGKIKNSIIKTRNLLTNFGFKGNNITSYNAIMPIIYYIYNDGIINNEIIDNEIRKYFIVAQLKNLFGVASNSALTETRKALKGKKVFALNLLKDISLVGNRNYVVSRDEIDDWLDTYKQGSSYTFMILSIIDPNFNSSKFVDEDHLFAESILRKNSDFYQYKDKIPNLNLLQAKENRKEKSDMLLEEYINQLKNKKKNPADIIKFLPKLNEELQNYDLNHFIIFYNMRKKLIGDKLEEILG